MANEVISAGSPNAGDGGGADEAVSTERSRNYFRQLTGGAAFRIGTALVNFCTLPLMIKYLGVEKFGVWSTLLAIMSWVVLLDLGIGNGLKNRIAQALAEEDEARAAGYISSGYFLLGLLVLGLLIVLLVLSVMLPLHAIFNTGDIAESSLRHAFQLTGFLVLLNFWLGLIQVEAGALQRTSLIALAQFISAVFSFMTVLALIYTTQASLSYLAAAYGVSLVLGNLAIMVWFFTRYPALIPRPTLFPDHIRPLMSSGFRFLIIQVAVLVLFTTDKVVIAQLYGAGSVTPYEVGFRLFSIITLVFGLLSTPLWSAYTDAFYRNDTGWIRRMMNLQLKVYVVVVLVTIALALLSEPIVKLWIGTQVTLSGLLVFAFALFTLISAWNQIFATFVNGIDRIRPQFYASIVAMLINIPLSLWFALHFGLGQAGVLLGTCVSLAIPGIVLPIQVYRIIGNEFSDRGLTHG